MIKIEKFVFNAFMENTFLVWDEISGEAAVIDPGCYDAMEQNHLAGFIISNSLKLKYLVNTHCHIDHIFGNSFIKNNYDVTFFAPEEDVFLLELMEEQARNYGMKLSRSPKPDAYAVEMKNIYLGKSEGRFLKTPGHSPGEVCLYFPEDKKCFTGDVLFFEGIGRTDLWGGNYDDLENSIRTKLFTLADDVEILPGHGDYSSIGHEKKHNPFL